MKQRIYLSLIHISEAEPPIPEWKVYFDGDFWGHSGKDRSGTELRLNKQFDWEGHHWVIPAAYSCKMCIRDSRQYLERHPSESLCRPAW